MSVSTSDLDLIHDFAMLTYAKDLKGFMNNSQRTVYFKALERVQARGQSLFEHQVAEIEYSMLKQRVLDFELHHPYVVK
jgi:hypothetical protein